MIKVAIIVVIILSTIIMTMYENFGIGFNVIELLTVR